MVHEFPLGSGKSEPDADLLQPAEQPGVPGDCGQPPCGPRLHGAQPAHQAGQEQTLWHS